MKIDFASAARGLRKTEKRADGTAKVSKAAGEESCVESKFPEKMLLLLKGRKNVSVGKSTFETLFQISSKLSFCSAF